MMSANQSRVQTVESVGVAFAASLAGLACVFNLWVLRAERQPVFYPNDNGLHLQMTEFAGRLLGLGQSPFDHWYPFFSLGSPFFVDYQSISAVITGGIGHFFNVKVVFALTLYLLLALWPFCVLYATRLLGWSNLVGGVAALCAPLLFSITGHGFEYKSYLWVGNGLWSQLWAMWTLPLAWGFCWRYIETRRGYVLATFFVAATIAFHFLTAYMAFVGLSVFVLVTWKNIRVRALRALLVAGGAGLVTLWVTLPVLAQGKWLAVNQFQVGTTINNSYGGGQAVAWLVRGDLYDSGRLPIITILALVGALWCWRHRQRDARARVLLMLWAVSFVWFSGRPTFAFLLNLIPGSQGILFQRYIAELQLTGLLLAGVGVMAVWELVTTFGRAKSPLLRDLLSLKGGQRSTAIVVSAAMAVAVLSPAWRESEAYAHRSAYWIGLQHRADNAGGVAVRTLVELAEQQGGGRIYAGMPSNWGRTFYVGDVPVYIYLEQLDVDAVGFTLRTSGTMTDPEAYFDQYNPGDYSAFGVHYLLLPSTMPAPVPASRIVTDGPYSLWSVAARGLFHIIQTQGTITANAATLGLTTAGFLQSFAIDHGVYPTIAYAGDRAAPTTLPSGAVPTSQGSGYVVHERDDLAEGTATATVVVNRTSVVLLSAAFEPGWRVSVDGFSAPTQMVAPALVGVQVGPGTHVITFTYHGFAYYGELVTIAVLAIAGGALLSYRSRRKPLAVRWFGKPTN